MAKTDAQRIDELQDQVYALQQLLLAHIQAFDDVSRDATDVTFAVAGHLSRSTLAAGRNRVAIRLDGMIEQLKSRRD
jgi:hypothetical protein